jgi:L-lactate dehydrogenase complex protein LldG
MPDARGAILGRLRAGAEPGHARIPGAPPEAGARVWSDAERLERFTRNLEAARAEVVPATRADWTRVARELLVAAGAHNLAYGPASVLGRELAAAWPAGAPDLVDLVPYDRPIEELKARLFSDVDAGLTSTLGGIAETGSLVLQPSPEEPRLLSLVPPIHVAVVESARLWSTLSDAISELGWARRAPRNGLLISGPSKTADIEQTLAYGVHGPKRLLVILVS